MVQKTKVLPRLTAQASLLFSFFVSKFVLLVLQDAVRSQDTVFVIAGVTGSVQGRELAWKFVKENWTTLHGRYKGGFILARLVKVSHE